VQKITDKIAKFMGSKIKGFAIHKELTNHVRVRNVIKVLTFTDCYSSVKVQQTNNAEKQQR